MRENSDPYAITDDELYELAVLSLAVADPERAMLPLLLAVFGMHSCPDCDDPPTY